MHAMKIAKIKEIEAQNYDFVLQAYQAADQVIQPPMMALDLSARTINVGVRASISPSSDIAQTH
jgi:hypothetical protein